MVSSSWWFGFFVGCAVTSASYQFSHIGAAIFPPEDTSDTTGNGILPESIAKTDVGHATDGDTVVEATLIKEIDCKNHHAQNDPNADLKEDPKKYITENDPNFWISLHKKSFDSVRWNIMKTGDYYETDITAQFKEILHSKPKGIVVDVGMNIGWYTLYSRAMGHDVVAFDPNPIMHSRVCTSIKLNEWWDGFSDTSSSGGVTTFAYGLGDKVDSFNLTMGSNPGASSFIQSNIRKFRGTLEVPVTTLDLVAAQMGWLPQENQQQQDKNDSTTIHLLKIDAEGYEPFIVRGASALLNSGLVENILMESTPHGKSSDYLVEMFTTFYNAGYFVHNVRGWASNIDEVESEDIKKALNTNLEEGTFEGSDSNKMFRKNKCDMWWKKRE